MVAMEGIHLFLGRLRRARNNSYCFAAETCVTAWIEQEANQLLADDLRGVLRIP
jgi:hypothetical protein